MNTTKEISDRAFATFDPVCKDRCFACEGRAIRHGVEAGVAVSDSEIEKLRACLTDIRSVVRSLPIGALGIAQTSDDAWSIRDEVIYNIEKALGWTSMLSIASRDTGDSPIET